MANEIGRSREISTNIRNAGEGSSYDLIRAQARERQAREESSSRSNEHSDQGEPSSRRQDEHLVGTDHPRTDLPSILVAAERYISKEDQKRWETQNRELLERLEEHKNNLKNFDDSEFQKLIIDLNVASERKDDKIFLSARSLRHTLQQMSGPMADSLKANLSKVCNDMTLYIDEFMKQADIAKEAITKHLEHLEEIGQVEEVVSDNPFESQPFRDCLDYYTKLGRQACEEWGGVVTGWVERYNRIAREPIKTSDLNLNSRDLFSEEDVIENLQVIHEMFKVRDD